MKIELSPIERKALKAEAHDLDPVVMIGNEGLTPAVMREIDRNLKAHELIKVRAFTDVREDRVTWFETISNELDAAPVQHIGKILVFYRENPDKKEPAKPAKRRGPRLTKRQEQDKALGVKRPKGAQKFKPEPKAKTAPKGKFSGTGKGTGEGRSGARGKTAAYGKTAAFGKPAPKGKPALTGKPAPKGDFARKPAGRKPTAISGSPTTQRRRTRS
jgi:RNA-binding protein